MRACKAVTVPRISFFAAAPGEAACSPSVGGLLFSAMLPHDGHNKLHYSVHLSPGGLGLQEDGLWQSRTLVCADWDALHVAMLQPRPRTVRGQTVKVKPPKGFQ